MTEAQVIADINAKIYTNGVAAITGAIGNDVLKNTMWGNLYNKILPTFPSVSGAAAGGDTILESIAKLQLQATAALSSAAVSVGAIPYKDSSSTYADSHFTRESGGIIMANSKYLRSSVSNKARIDFGGAGGDTFTLSTDGATGTTAKLVVAPAATSLGTAVSGLTTAAALMALFNPTAMSITTPALSLAITSMLMTAGASFDVVASGGSDVMNIGTANADIINIGWSGTTINMTGTLAYQNVTNLAVTDKLITLNKGGSAASAVASGFELEENALITGYFRTSADRAGYDFLAPAVAFAATLNLSALTANRIFSTPNVAGTLIVDGGSYANPSWITALAWGKITGTPTTLAGYGITDAVTNTTIILPQYGGTGIANNSASTWTVSGSFATTVTVSATTAVTLPTSGTIFSDKVTSITSAQLLGALINSTGTGVAVFGTSPTFTTSIIAPKIIGGTGTTQTLTYQTTSGVGATGADHIFLVGNNGATEAFRIKNNATSFAYETFTTTITGTNDSIIALNTGTALGAYPTIVARGVTYESGLWTANLNHGSLPNTGGIYTNATNGFVISDASTARVTVNTVAQSSGARINFLFEGTANTAQTAGTNTPNLKVTGLSKQFATGTLSLQYFNYLSANTIAFVASSTATQVYGLYVDASIAGTNATIGSNFGIGTDGRINANASGSGSGYYIFTNPVLQIGVGSGVITGGLTFGQGTTQIAYVPASVSSGSNATFPTHYFTFPANTAITAGAISAGVKFNAGTKQWATGAVGTQIDFWLTPHTYTAVGASVFTDAFACYIEAPTASTNVTITNKWCLALIGGGLQVAAGTTTYAPIRIPSGVNTTTAVPGNVEFNGTNLFFSIASTRLTVNCSSSGATAPATNSIGVILDYYGTSATRVLTTPDSWESVNIGGTVYKRPLYL